MCIYDEEVNPLCYKVKRGSCDFNSFFIRKYRGLPKISGVFIYKLIL